jgi:hypothetical protein
MVKEVSQRSALSESLSVLNSALISRSRDIRTATARRQVYLDWERLKFRVSAIVQTHSHNGMTLNSVQYLYCSTLECSFA